MTDNVNHHINRLLNVDCIFDRIINKICNKGSNNRSSSAHLSYFPAVIIIERSCMHNEHNCSVAVQMPLFQYKCDRTDMLESNSLTT